jgi:adenylate kinase family enzyme
MATSDQLPEAGTLNSRPHAILLVGPTGAGKTPLGELLDRHGLAGRRCLHFDFGAQLRRAVETLPSRGQSPRGMPSAGAMNPDETAFLRHVLASNALLEDKDFPLAAKILLAFLAERGAGPGDLLVLNGLPRHPGQARDLAAFVDVRTVIELSVRGETVLARLRADVNGDRAGRADDSPADVANKLRIFAARTQPLLDYYRRHGATVCRIEVGPATTAEEVRRQLQDKANVLRPTTFFSR